MDVSTILTFLAGFIVCRLFFPKKVEVIVWGDELKPDADFKKADHNNYFISDALNHTFGTWDLNYVFSRYMPDDPSKSDVDFSKADHNHYTISDALNHSFGTWDLNYVFSQYMPHRKLK
jgi:hypothetical protein